MYASAANRKPVPGYQSRLSYNETGGYEAVTSPGNYPQRQFDGFEDHIPLQTRHITAYSHDPAPHIPRDENAHIPHDGRRGSPYRSNYLDSDRWTWEIAAMVTSVLCVGIEIAILIMVDRNPLRSWPLAISINTTIAILTTAAKTMMLFAIGSCLGQLKWIYLRNHQRMLYDIGLFDAAAMGPLGAVELLFKVRWPIALLGSLIVLLSLAIDPFAQQLVRIVEFGNIIPSDEASFGIIHNYSTPAHFDGSQTITKTSSKYARGSTCTEEATRF
jgi:hypothetical protein